MFCAQLISVSFTHQSIFLTKTSMVRQYYDRTNFAVPSNFDFTKYARINFAFFQTNVDGDIWGTDEWAGECFVSFFLLHLLIITSL